MTTVSNTGQHPHRTAPGLRRVAAVGTMLILGLLAPTAAGASPAGDPGPGGPDELGVEQPCLPDLCPPDPPEPPECPPFLATCDLAPGGDGPDDPEPPEPPTGEPGEPPADGIDAPVVATPNFTG